MKRREFIAGLAGSVLTPHALRAQQGGRVRRIAILVGPAETDPEVLSRISAFKDGLRGLGWIEGQNVTIETRWGAGNVDRIRAHAKELVQSDPDIIFVNSTPTTAALKNETSTIPIVFALVSDPVGDGFVASLSRPGGNITGFSSFDSEIGGKWLELVKEIAPAVTRIALIFNPRTAPGGGEKFIRPFFDAAARTLSVEPVYTPVQSPAEIDSALKAYAKTPNSGLLAMPDSFIVVNSAQVIRLSNELRIPAVYPFKFFATDGGLASYGVDTVDLNRRAATYVDRILKGASPAELPIQTPTKFELTINLKTAKTLGLTVPLSLQSRADEVIE